MLLREQRTGARLLEFDMLLLLSLLSSIPAIAAALLLHFAVPYLKTQILP